MLYTQPLEVVQSLTPESRILASVGTLSRGDLVRLVAIEPGGDLDGDVVEQQAVWLTVAPTDAPTPLELPDPLPEGIAQQAVPHGQQLYYPLYNAAGELSHMVVVDKFREPQRGHYRMPDGTDVTHIDFPVPALQAVEAILAYYQPWLTGDGAPLPDRADKYALMGQLQDAMMAYFDPASELARHVSRQAGIALRIMEAVSQSDHPLFRDVRFDRKEKGVHDLDYYARLSLLHDIGKMAAPQDELVYDSGIQIGGVKFRNVKHPLMTLVALQLPGMECEALSAGHHHPGRKPFDGLDLDSTRMLSKIFTLADRLEAMTGEREGMPVHMRLSVAEAVAEMLYQALAEEKLDMHLLRLMVEAGVHRAHGELPHVRHTEHIADKYNLDKRLDEPLLQYLETHTDISRFDSLEVIEEKLISIAEQAAAPMAAPTAVRQSPRC